MRSAACGVLACIAAQPPDRAHRRCTRSSGLTAWCKSRASWAATKMPHVRPDAFLLIDHAKTYTGIARLQLCQYLSHGATFCGHGRGAVGVIAQWTGDMDRTGHRDGSSQLKISVTGHSVYGGSRLNRSRAGGARCSASSRRRCCSPASSRYVGAEVDAGSFLLIPTHGLAQHREPGLRARQPAVQAAPACPGIARGVDRGLAADGGSWPDRLSIHGYNPCRVRIGRVQDDREADVADFFRHRRTDALPAPLWPVEPIDAAVILLVQPLRFRRMLHHAVRVIFQGSTLGSG